MSAFELLKIDTLPCGYVSDEISPTAANVWITLVAVVEAQV